jgi:hypothetical protein
VNRRPDSLHVPLKSWATLIGAQGHAIWLLATAIPVSMTYGQFQSYRRLLLLLLLLLLLVLGLPAVHPGVIILHPSTIAAVRRWLVGQPRETALEMICYFVCFEIGSLESEDWNCK